MERVIIIERVVYQRIIMPVSLWIGIVWMRKCLGSPYLSHWARPCSLRSILYVWSVPQIHLIGSDILTFLFMAQSWYEKFQVFSEFVSIYNQFMAFAGYNYCTNRVLMIICSPDIMFSPNGVRIYHFITGAQDM